MELILKIDNQSDFYILLPLLKRLGISFKEKNKKPNSSTPTPNSNLSEIPINWSENPDFMAVAGIWKDRNVDADQLRKAAWGDRM